MTTSRGPLPEPAEMRRRFKALAVLDVLLCQTHDLTWRIYTFDVPDREDPDGAGWLLEVLLGGPVAYQSYAEYDFETELELPLVESVFEHQPITPGILEGLGATIEPAPLRDELDAIGYPMPGDA